MAYQKGKTERLRRIVVEEMWLRYYNQSLFAKGLITERRFRQMEVAIIIQAEKKMKEVKRC